MKCTAHFKNNLIRLCKIWHLKKLIFKLKHSLNHHIMSMFILLKCSMNFEFIWYDFAKYRSLKISHSYYYIEIALEFEYVSSMIVNLRKYLAYLCFRSVFTPYILWNFRCHFVENDIQTQWRKHVTKLLVTPNVSLLLYREWHKTWVWKHDSHSGRNWTFFHVKIRSLLQKVKKNPQWNIQVSSF